MASVHVNLARCIYIDCRMSDASQKYTPFRVNDAATLHLHRVNPPVEFAVAQLNFRVVCYDNSLTHILANMATFNESKWPIKHDTRKRNCELAIVNMSTTCPTEMDPETVSRELTPRHSRLTHGGKGSYCIWHSTLGAKHYIIKRGSILSPGHNSNFTIQYSAVRHLESSVWPI